MPSASDRADSPPHGAQLRAGTVAPGGRLRYVSLESEGQRGQSSRPGFQPSKRTWPRLSRRQCLFEAGEKGVTWPR